MNTLCLYHKNCPDGFGAAYAVREWVREQGNLPGIELKQTEFRAIQYGDDIPGVSGLNVIIVDFSFPRDALLRMKEQARDILVIDHHKTAEAELKDLDFCIFDMQKSGCVLTWEYFFPHTPVPSLFLYLQDRDLWQWQLPDSKEVSASLRSYPAEFAVWEDFMTPAGVEILKAEGSAIVRYQRQQVNFALINPISYIELGGHRVPCINCTHLISEIGNELAQGQPFAALYFDTGEKRVFNLRSTDQGVDVATIAKQYGGGGHRNAAGFTVKKSSIITEKS